HRHHGKKEWKAVEGNSFYVLPAPNPMLKGLIKNSIRFPADCGCLLTMPVEKPVKEKNRLILSKTCSW
ncbi:MAG: hypothetical protein M0T81_09530, partial [Thermoplasmatales archaeon]|nr:hypothetical protein [Thermoplasmatales archaeon]